MTDAGSLQSPGSHVGSLMERLGSLDERKIRFFRQGRIEERSYPELQADVKEARRRLSQLGVESGTHVGIVAPNCYEWVVCDLALISLGAVVVALPVEFFGDTEPEQMADAYGVSLLLTTEARAEAAMRPWVAPLALKGDIALHQRRSPATGESDPDLFSLVFSSGTSGKLKCLRISRQGTDQLLSSFGRDFEFRSDDAILAFLPLGAFQQRWMLYAAVVYGFDLLLCEATQLFHALRDLRPTILAAPPLLYETIEARYYALPRLRRRALDAVRSVLGRLPSALRRRIGSLLFAPIYRALGGRTRFLLTGAAPSRRSTLELFASIGLDLYQAYGLTETGFLSWNLPRRNRTGSVGLPVYPGSLELASDGEIIFEHPRPLTLGYLGVDGEESRNTFLSKTRVATGDIGRFDADGYLYIEGRKKQIILTQGGVKIHPEELEAAIECNARVARAVVFGGGDFPVLTAVVSLRSGDEPAARRAVNETIAGVNARRPASARLEKVIFTSEQFTRENGLLNRSLKVDRARALERFADELTNTYGDECHAGNAA